jgi:hypothetical protein
MLAMARNRLVVRRRAGLGVTVKLLVPAVEGWRPAQDLVRRVVDDDVAGDGRMVNLTVVLPAWLLAGRVEYDLACLGARLRVLAVLAGDGRLGRGVFVRDVGAGSLLVTPRR